MESTDFDDFGNRLTVLGEIFDAKLSPAKSALYFEALRDLSLTDVIRALNLAARKSTFMPRPAELRTFITGDDEDAAAQAWMLLQRAMREVGAWSSVVMEDAALAETVLAMWPSWPSLCDLDQSVEMWANTRKDFGRIYRTMRNRNLQGDRYLVGICEQNNAGKSEWMRYVQVKRISSDGTPRWLSIDEAQAVRATLAPWAPVSQELQEARS